MQQDPHPSWDRRRAGQFCVHATNCRIPEQLAQTSPRNRGECGEKQELRRYWLHYPTSLSFETLYHMNSSLWIQKPRVVKGGRGCKWSCLGAERNSISCVAAWEKKKNLCDTVYIRKSPLGSRCLAHFHSYFLGEEANSCRLSALFWPYLMVFWFSQPNSHWSSTLAPWLIPPNHSTVTGSITPPLLSFPETLILCLKGSTKQLTEHALELLMWGATSGMRETIKRTILLHVSSIIVPPLFSPPTLDCLQYWN